MNQVPTVQLQTAPRVVMALTMDEKQDEIQAMGIVQAPDGPRVVLGCGLRHRASYDPRLVKKPPIPCLALALDPAQAMETAQMLTNLAIQVAAMRGETTIPVEDMPTTGMDPELATELAQSNKGQAFVSSDGVTVGRARNSIGILCQVRLPGMATAEDGGCAVGNITMPDGGEWLAVAVQQGEESAVATMPLSHAVAFSDTLMDAIRHAVEIEQSRGKPS